MGTFISQVSSVSSKAHKKPLSFIIRGWKTFSREKDVGNVEKLVTSNW